ncbi:13195_t:CDS:2 [Gigaspora rosea]|nr:13195_t:CDS:2 [Gigaspora rosea]
MHLSSHLAFIIDLTNSYNPLTDPEGVEFARLVLKVQGSGVASHTIRTELEGINNNRFIIRFAEERINLEGRIKKSSILRKNGIVKPNQLVIHGKGISKKKQKRIERQLRYEICRRVEKGEMVPEKIISDVPSDFNRSNINSQQTVEMDIVSFGSGTILGAPSLDSLEPEQIILDNF